MSKDDYSYHLKGMGKAEGGQTYIHDALRAGATVPKMLIIDVSQVSGISATLIRNKNTLTLNSQSHFLFPCLRVRAGGQGMEKLNGRS
jgi:hypothetical protein